MEPKIRNARNGYNLYCTFMIPFMKDDINQIAERWKRSPEQQVYWNKLFNERKERNPHNSYILFCNAIRPEILRQNPGMEQKQAISQVGRYWREMSPELQDFWTVLQRGTESGTAAPAGPAGHAGHAAQNISQLPPEALLELLQQGGMPLSHRGG